MNSGLPSLLNAIFGKKDLHSVSLDEMYEVINEFPSFNAAHYLLSKKLEQEHHSLYEKESMRTALYFNNPLWLQSILLNENHGGLTQMDTRVPDKEIRLFTEPVLPEMIITEVVVRELLHTTEPEYPGDDPVPEPSEAETRPDETEFQIPENTAQTVTSFDELMSKYKIEIPEPEAEIQELPKEENPTPVLKTPVYSADEKTETVLLPMIPEPEPEPSPFRNEVLNEYGIFEETEEKKTSHDLDLEAFDRPIEQNTFVAEPLPVEKPQETNPAVENDDILENPVTGKSPEKSDEGDYDAFDRPVENDVQEKSVENEVQEGPVENVIQEGSFENEEQEVKTVETGFIPEESLVNFQSEPGHTHAEEQFTDEPEQGSDEQMHELVARFGEKQKSMPLFDAKKADAIVFAPYHMIDYFASQGIKLVLEDQPKDNLGKQLKSFTDWLKVMKKLPAQPVTDKQNEKEADRIRHFAAHSIEERDILTESMAEVLAKQGMYENAIALYQKLSLIYPPKSAYFASRIEQLKASLP